MCSLASKRSIIQETQCIDFIRRKMREEEDLVGFENLIPDRVLLHFVRGRKYDNDRAFRTLQEYLLLRKHKYGDFFKTVIPSQLKLKTKAFVPLKSKGQNGEYIMVSRIAWFPFSDKKLTFDDLLAKLVLIAEDICKHETAEFNGVSVIIDFEGFNLQMARLIGSYSNIQKLIAIFYKTVPLQYKQLHYINAPLSLRMIHNFAKQFLPTKFVQRIQIHDSSFESLHKQLPPILLPRWLGGDLTEEEAFDLEQDERILIYEEYYQKFASII